MRKMIFWKVKLESHRAPLTRISAALQVVWAPHLSYTCRTSPPWSQGFVTEAAIPPIVPFSTGFHPVRVFLWTWASTCFRHLTFKLDLLWCLNRCGWVFCFLLLFFFFCFVPVETKGKDRVSCAIFYSGVGDKCWKLGSYLHDFVDTISFHWKVL